MIPGLTKHSLSQLQQGKGCKTSSANYNGAPCKFILSGSEWFATPFGCSTYDKDPAATRLTCEIDVTGKDVLSLLQGMDRWAIEHVIQKQPVRKHDARGRGKAVSPVHTVL